MSKRQIIILAIIALSVVTAFLTYPYLPDKVASHWNAAGQVNGYMSRIWGAFLLPMILVVSYVIFLVVPHLDPKKHNIEKFRPQYENFIIAFMVFLYYTYVLTLFWNLGYRFGLIQLMAPGFALIFFSAGALLDHAEMNWTAGIRTPWTLSSPVVWKKTHQMGGRLFKLSAGLCLLGIVWPSLAIWLVLMPVVAVSLYLVLYSYLEWRKLGSPK
jgi:uncharacterized membrane protein